MIKGQLCTICKKQDDYSDETICHNCIEKWKKKLEQKERLRIIKLLFPDEESRAYGIKLTYEG